jgi:hypothetical protein
MTSSGQPHCRPRYHPAITVETELDCYRRKWLATLGLDRCLPNLEARVIGGQAFEQLL